MTGFIKRSLILIFLSLFTAGALFSQAAGTDAYEDVFFLAQRMYEQGAYEQCEKNGAYGQDDSYRPPLSYANPILYRTRAHRHPRLR